jgi:hypothetical protein
MLGYPRLSITPTYGWAATSPTYVYASLPGIIAKLCFGMISHPHNCPVLVRNQPPPFLTTVHTVGVVL